MLAGDYDPRDVIGCQTCISMSAHLKDYMRKASQESFKVNVGVPELSLTAGPGRETPELALAIVDSLVSG